MTDQVDEYIATTIRQGDVGSKLLAAKIASTLKNPLVDIVSSGMNGIAVLRPPKGSLVIVHSMGGDPRKTELREYVNSLVDRLVSGSQRIGAHPIGFGDVVDASSMDLEMISLIGDQLRERASHYHLPIMNGELADLGKRVNCSANLSGTMISIVQKNNSRIKNTGIFECEGITYSVFDPRGEAIFSNFDGIGTKTEFYERLMENNYDKIHCANDLACGVEDFIAMNADDTAKLAARLRVLSGVLETRGRIPVELIKEKLKRITSSFNVSGILQHEDMGTRIRGYREHVDTYNISGSAVSTINEERLKNLPKPLEGNSLVAIRQTPNPRSNGISAKRAVMTKLFGDMWHQREEGQLFLKYLAEPSTILYPLFDTLFKEDLATSVFHNSGGAYNGKLARPLAKHGLYIDLQDKLFEPDWREVALAAYTLTTKAAYEKWPMGTDGFVSTNNPKGAIALIKERGFDAREVGKLESAKLNSSDGQRVTGVRLRAFNGQEVYFSGRD